MTTPKVLFKKISKYYSKLFTRGQERFFILYYLVLGFIFLNAPIFLSAQVQVEEQQLLQKVDSLTKNHQDIVLCETLLTRFVNQEKLANRLPAQALIKLLYIKTVLHDFKNAFALVRELEEEPRFQRDPSLRYQLMFRKMVVYLYSGRYDIAILILEELIGEEENKKEKDFRRLAILYNSQGNNYKCLGLKSAENSYLRAIEYGRLAGQFNYPAYNNIIDYFIGNLNYEAAGEYIDTLANRALSDGNIINLISSKDKRAHLLAELDKPAPAKALMYENRRLEKEYAITQNLSGDIYESYVYFASGQLDSAIIKGQPVLDYAIRQKEIDLAETCMTHLAKVYTAAENYEQAIKIQQQYFQMQNRVKKMVQIEAITLGRQQKYADKTGSGMGQFWWGVVIALGLGGLTWGGFLWWRRSNRSEEQAENSPNIEVLRNQMYIKNQLLIMSNLARQQSIHLLQQLKTDIRGLGHDKAQLPKNINQLINKINNTVDFQDQWDKINMQLQELYPAFLNQIKKEYPQLTDTELRYCIFYKLHLTTEEIAQILNIEPSSVNSARYRLKKKVDIDRLLAIS